MKENTIKYYSKIITDNGGIISNVTQKLDYLISNESNEKTTKYKKVVEINNKLYNTGKTHAINVLLEKELITILEKININIGEVDITEEQNKQLTDLQVYGISTSIVNLIGQLKKYILLTQIQKELQAKPVQIQPIMREMYQYRETETIMDIRTQLDMVYVYTVDEIVVKNYTKIRESFELAINYLTSNMSQVKSVLDKDYTEILDEFCDKLKEIADSVSQKSIFDEQFKIV
jgi:hypothetical protein